MPPNLLCLNCVFASGGVVMARVWLAAILTLWMPASVSWAMYVPILVPVPAPVQPVYGPPAYPGAMAAYEEMARLGYLSDPWSDGVMKAVVHDGLVAADDVGLPGTHWFKLSWTLTVDDANHDIHILVQAEEQTREKPGKVRTIVGWIVGTGVLGGGCLGPYWIDPETRFDPDGDPKEWPLCLTIIRRISGSDELTSQADHAFGWLVEEITAALRVLSGISIGDKVLLLTMDEEAFVLWSRAAREIAPLDVAAHIRDQRAMVPLAVFRGLGFDVTYWLGRITIRRPSDGFSARYQIGANRAESDRRLLFFDVPPYIKKNRAFAPARPTLGEFCYGIDYQPRHRRVMATCET